MAPSKMTPPMSPAASDASTSAEPVDTLLFVDVDGVLNVGIRDGCRPPLLLDRRSAESALSLWESRFHHPERDSIERLVHVIRREVGRGEEPGATFEQFSCTTSHQYAEQFVERFAKLLKSAGWEQPTGGDAGPGGRATAVLTSTWRSPQHRARLSGLEQTISKHLGSDFCFDAKTSPREEHTPEGRLRNIKLYLHDACRRRKQDLNGRSRPLRVLVLDDFYNRPLDGVGLGDGSYASSCADVENWLTQGLPCGLDVDVKMLHTFTEWTAKDGMQLQVGSGLSQEHFQCGINFLEFGSEIETPKLGPGAAALPPHYSLEVNN